MGTTLHLRWKPDYIDTKSRLNFLRLSLTHNNYTSSTPITNHTSILSLEGEKINDQTKTPNQIYYAYRFRNIFLSKDEGIGQVYIQLQTNDVQNFDLVRQ